MKDTEKNRSKVKEHCMKSIAAIPLLSSLPADGIRSIIDCLIEHCVNEDHVQRALKQFTQKTTDWKNPIAELVSIANATRDLPRAPLGCDKCRLDNDAKTGAPRHNDHPKIIVRSEYEFADRCDCERGAWLKAQDQKRAQEQVRTSPGMLQTFKTE